MWPHLILFLPHTGALARVSTFPTSPAAESEALRKDPFCYASVGGRADCPVCLLPSAQIFMALEAGVDNVCKMLAGLPS